MSAFEEELRFACELAERAAAMIRAEFFREGGPRRSSVDKAPIDIEIERELRRAIKERFPRHGIHAEELPDENVDGDAELGRCFVIDPNDGTRAFLRGLRGSTISIGMLEHGRPVLGVVSAPTIPGGDFFCWAEGTEPLRNGEVMAPLDTTRRWLNTTDLVLLSPAANRYAHQNAAAVTPARFSGVPSLAYRLALAAAGEAVAAHSLFGPAKHDYAAGHALLLGVGGQLFDERGDVVDYTRQVAGCAGGVPALAKEIATRDFSEAIRSSRDSLTSAFAFAESPPGDAFEDDGVLLRARGALFGQCAGDSLGSLVEFRSPASIRSEYPMGVSALADGGTFDTIAGQPTDDTEMALALARSLLQSGPDLEGIAHAYVSWYDSQPFDLGNTVGAAVRAGRRARQEGQPILPAMAASASQQSQANGALMRAVPLAIYGAFWEPVDLARLARADAALTHPHRACSDANVIYVSSIAHAIRTGASGEGVYEFALALAKSIGAHEVVREAIDRAADGPEDALMDQMGWLKHAMRNAFAELLRPLTVGERISATVGRGGDTDTNAAIAGALLGAVAGERGVPHAWRWMVRSCRPEHGFANVSRPRPAWLWPVDVDALAERLLVHGRAYATR